MHLNKIQHISNQTSTANYYFYHNSKLSNCLYIAAKTFELKLNSHALIGWSEKYQWLTTKALHKTYCKAFTTYT